MLRVDLFKTVDRALTRFIAVRDTISVPDPNHDAHHFDVVHANQGRFGIGWHFLILLDGTIQLCRDIHTCGSHTRNLDRTSVAIGVVGGKLEDGTRAHTRTAEQEAALGDLVAFIALLYPGAELSDNPPPPITTPP